MEVTDNSGQDARQSGAPILTTGAEESLDSLPSKYNFPLKKARTQFSPKQVVHLEEMFSENQFPNARQRDEIAEKLDLSVQNVQVWFQNRRAKHRRKTKRKEETEDLISTVIKPPAFWPQNLPFDSNISKGSVIMPDEPSNTSNSSVPSLSLSTSQESLNQSVTVSSSPHNQCYWVSEPSANLHPQQLLSESSLPSISSHSSSDKQSFKNVPQPKIDLISPSSRCTCSTTISLQHNNPDHSDDFITRLPTSHQHSLAFDPESSFSPSIFAESPVHLYDILKDMPDLTGNVLDQPLVITTQPPILQKETLSNHVSIQHDYVPTPIKPDVRQPSFTSLIHMKEIYTQQEINHPSRDLQPQHHLSPQGCSQEYPTGHSYLSQLAHFPDIPQYTYRNPTISHPDQLPRNPVATSSQTSVIVMESQPQEVTEYPIEPQSHYS